MDLRRYKISEKVDAVMLSHGHWDHAGGMTKALDLIVTAKGCKDYCQRPGKELSNQNVVQI